MKGESELKGMGKKGGVCAEAQSLVVTYFAKEEKTASKIYTC